MFDEIKFKFRDFNLISYLWSLISRCRDFFFNKKKNLTISFFQSFSGCVTRRQLNYHTLIASNLRDMMQKVKWSKMKKQEENKNFFFF